MHILYYCDKYYDVLLNYAILVFYGPQIDDDDKHVLGCELCLGHGTHHGL